MELLEKLFDMFIQAAAIYAALEVLYVALMCGAIYLVLKALRQDMSETLIFLLAVACVAVIILAPSYFEKKK